MLLEVIVTNVQEAILAQEYGADRLELIHAFTVGGLSPDKNLAQEVCSAVTIPINVNGVEFYRHELIAKELGCCV
jgi:copper homeostasis protein